MANLRQARRSSSSPANRRTAGSGLRRKPAKSSPINPPTSGPPPPKPHPCRCLCTRDLPRDAQGIDAPPAQGRVATSAIAELAGSGGGDGGLDLTYQPLDGGGNAGLDVGAPATPCTPEPGKEHPHPTSNIEHPMAACCSVNGCWAFDVGCWIFPGFMGRARVRGNGAPNCRDTANTKPSTLLIRACLFGPELHATEFHPLHRLRRARRPRETPASRGPARSWPGCPLPGPPSLRCGAICRGKRAPASAASTCPAVPGRDHPRTERHSPAPRLTPKRPRCSQHRRR